MRRLLTLLIFGAPLGAQVPVWQRPVVLAADSSIAIEVRTAIAYTGRPELTARMDVYRPTHDAAPLPAVLLVHGGPTTGLPVEARLVGQYTSLGRLIAARGLAAVTFTHRLSDVDAVDTAASDVRSALAYVVTHATELKIDPTRLCVWAISAGGMVLVPALRDAAARLRCFVAYYTIFSPDTFRQMMGSVAPGGPRPATLIRLVTEGEFVLPPSLVVRAGKDVNALNGDLDAFVAAALAKGSNLELHAYADGQHAFDILDDTPTSREILARTLEFVAQRLTRR
jgi:acetyl esterase/lipase